MTLTARTLTEINSWDEGILMEIHQNCITVQVKNPLNLTGWEQPKVTFLQGVHFDLYKSLNLIQKGTNTAGKDWM